MTRTLLAALLVGAPFLAAPMAAATPSTPPELPTPAGWRTETIPFPLAFAPTLDLRGVEELRFAPGMFREGAEDFWSYGFLWLLEEPIDPTPSRLTADLATYFQGLAAAVRKSKELPQLALTLTGSLHPEGDGLAGEVQAFDAFVTQRVVPLRVEVHPVPAPAGYAQALWFALSPRPATHPVWAELDGIRRGYRSRSSAQARLP